MRAGCFVSLNSFSSWARFVGVMGEPGGDQPFLTAVLAVSDWFYVLLKL